MDMSWSLFTMRSLKLLAADVSEVTWTQYSDPPDATLMICSDSQEWLECH